MSLVLVTRMIRHKSGTRKLRLARALRVSRPRRARRAPFVPAARRPLDARSGLSGAARRSPLAMGAEPRRDLFNLVLGALGELSRLGLSLG